MNARKQYLETLGKEYSQPSESKRRAEYSAATLAREHGRVEGGRVCMASPARFGTDLAAAPHFAYRARLQAGPFALCCIDGGKPEGEL